MTVLENEIEIGRKKNTLGSFYEEAKKAIASNNIEQAIDLTEQGRLQAELENNYEWVQRFNSFNSAIKSKPSLNTIIAKEDITIIKGIGPSVAQKLREHGFDTIEKLAKSTIPQLSSIKGIGPATAQKIREGSKALISRKKLNDFSQQEGAQKEPPTHEESGDYTEDDYNEMIKEVKVQNWFSDKHNKPKSGVWYPSQNLLSTEKTETISMKTGTISQIYPIVDELVDVEDDIIEEQIPEISLRSAKLSFIEDEPLGFAQIDSPSLQKPRVILTQEEKIDSFEKQMIESQIEQVFQMYDYNIIKNIPLLNDIFSHVDVIGVKKVNFNDVLEFVIIIPLKVNSFKGGLQVSNDTIKYVPNNHQFKENGSVFKMFLDSYFDTLQESYRSIHHDLVEKASFHSFLRRHFGINISTKKTITRKNLFFTEGNMEVKLFIEPILLCQNKIGFLEKDIPFAYLSDINLHIVTQNNLAEVVHFIEQKYTLLETYRKEDHSLISYNELYNQFLKRSTFFSIPFIGFGVIVLFLIVFQSFETMKSLLNIGYALLGVFFITIPFFYMKVLKPRLEIQTIFENLHYKVKPSLNETSLLLINEHFSPELMSQFGYECLGKQHHSKIITQIEEDQIKESIENNRLQTQVKNDGLFESEISDNKVNRYGSFLEE
ncbi:MAG: helix-hairpin-helix domain-containing protein [Promethearchaeota archaeon]